MFNYKIIFLSLFFVFMFFFLFSFINVQSEQKEINCITYYTSLGYTANGCEDVVKKFIENGDLYD